MFTYTVLQYSFYQTLADNQQIGEVTVPVNRGTLYSSFENGTILSTSLNLYDVAIDPMIEGDINKLEQFLRDAVYMEICEDTTKLECYNSVLKFLKVLEIENFVYSEEYIKKLISDRLIDKLSQSKVTSVLIDKELEYQQVVSISGLGLLGVYPSGAYIYLNPEEILESDITAAALSPYVGLSEEKLKHLMRKRDLRYIPIINRLSIQTSEYIKTYIEEEKIAYKKGLIEKKDTIAGFFILTPEPNRYYPEKDVAAQVIGFVSNDGKGHYGIEGYFNDILKGNNGKIVSKKDVLGRIINSIDFKQEDIIGEGVEIHSTIDRNIQKRVEMILEDGVKKYRANKGTVVVMEPQTGKVLAMANYPSYDLNNYGDVYELEKVRFTKYPDPKVDLLGMPVFVEDSINGDKFIYDSKEIHLRKATREEVGNSVLVKYKYKNDFGPQVYQNDAISSLYEPGSIMKTLTVAIGLDTGEITKNSKYLDEGELSIDQFKIKNVSDKCLGFHTFAHALNYSCNVGMIRIVQRIGKVLVHQYLNDFGFSEPTGIELEGEVTASINPWERWSKAQLYTSSYGLGVSTTPLQMANAYSIIVNGGVYIKPRVIDYIEFPDGRKVYNKIEPVRRVLKESTSLQMKQWLVSSAQDGVANNGNVPGYSVGGKTGTSQIPYQGGYETGIGSTIGSYAGFGPAEDPKFVIIVKLDRPRTSEYGGATSAHIFKQTAQFMFDYYKIPRRSVTEK